MRHSFSRSPQTNELSTENRPLNEYVRDNQLTFILQYRLGYMISFLLFLCLIEIHLIVVLLFSFLG